MGRRPCCEKTGMKRGRWTAEEDELLTTYIQSNGQGSWRSLPKNAGLLRCGKSCRLRWINYLRDDLKRGNFTVEEEETIVKLHATLGNRWSLMAAHLPGRTDNEIKNYWNSHLSRTIYNFKYILKNLDICKPTSPSTTTTKKKKKKKQKINKIEAKEAVCDEEEEESENKLLEPYEWLDFEIEKLSNAFNNNTQNQDDEMISLGDSVSNTSTYVADDEWLDWICTSMDTNETQ